MTKLFPILGAALLALFGGWQTYSFLAQEPKRHQAPDMPVEKAHLQIRSDDRFQATEIITSEVSSHQKIKHTVIDIRKSFAKAADLRFFALEAMQHPEEGGYFYALKASAFCIRDSETVRQGLDEAIRQTVAKNGTISNDAIKRVNRFQTMCSAFAPGEATDLVRSIQELGKSGKDPLLSAFNAFEKSNKERMQTGADTFSESAKALIDTKDLSLVAHQRSLERIMMSTPSGSADENGNIWFEGKLYDKNNMGEYVSILYAIELASCQDDIPCELDDSMAMACMGRVNQCLPDRMAYIRFRLKESANEDSFADVQKISQKIQSAVLLGNYSAFIRK